MMPLCHVNVFCCVTLAFSITSIQGFFKELESEERNSGLGLWK